MQAPIRPFARLFGADVARKRRGPSREAVQAAVRRKGHVPYWEPDLPLTRARCRCGCRYAVRRSHLDLRDPRAILRADLLECGACGRTLRRLHPTDWAADPDRLMTLVLPASFRLYRSRRGALRKLGSDAVEIPEATWPQLTDACTAYRKRADRRAETEARHKAEREAAEHETHKRTSALLARIHEADRRRAEEEREAAEREG